MKHRSIKEHWESEDAKVHWVESLEIYEDLAKRVMDVLNPKK